MHKKTLKCRSAFALVSIFILTNIFGSNGIFLSARTARANDYYCYKKYAVSYNVTQTNEEYNSAAIFGPFSGGQRVTTYSGFDRSGNGFVLYGSSESGFGDLTGCYVGDSQCVRYIYSGIKRSYYRDFNVGTPYQYTQFVYVYDCTKWTITSYPGSLVEDYISSPAGVYPDNGIHTDGYWYIKISGIPRIEAVSPAEDGKYISGSFSPSVTVAHPEGRTLTCKLYVDADNKPLDTKLISNTATPQLVNFKTLDVNSISEGEHTLKFEVGDGISKTLSRTVKIEIDKTIPALTNVTLAAGTKDLQLSVTASDTGSGLGSKPYRYSAGAFSSGWVSSNTYTINSLTPNTQYNAVVEVMDNVGNVASKETLIYTKAQVPEIKPDSFKETGMNLSISDSNPAPTQYQIMAGTGYITADGTLTSSPEWITVSSKKLTITGLSPNTLYTFKAKAKNAEALETDFSAAKTGTTLAQPPDKILLEPGINFMKISWTPSVGPIGYDLEADGKVMDMGTATSYTHSGLQTETSHSYRVRVRNAGGTGAWSELQSGSTLPDPPAAPVITGKEAARTAVTLTWDAVAKAAGYEIEADGKAIDAGTATTYTDEGLQPDSLHKYRVRAVNAGGKSDWSTAEEVRTLPDPPETPASLKGSPKRTTVSLTWDAAERAEGYEIELDGSIRSTGTATSYLHEGLSTRSAHTYRIRAWNKGGKSEWSEPLYITTWPEIPVTPSDLMATAEKDAITVTWYNAPLAESYDIQVDGASTGNVTEASYTHKGLAPGTKHTYRVRARNISGESEWSKPVEMSTLPQETETGTKLQALSNIVAVVTNKSVMISWQAAAVDVRYEVEIDGKVSDNGKETVYNHTGLKPLSFHAYRVRMLDRNGNGQWCAVLALSTLPDLPGAPSNVSATAADMQIELRWDKEDGTSYEVEVDGKVLDAGEASSYTSGGLKPGTSHTYRIRGKNVTGVTAWSNAITKSTTSPSYEVECTKGNSFDFSLLASNIQDFSGMTFVVSYNPDELEVEDLCDFTAARDGMAEGRIPGTNLSVKYSAGRIEFTVNESIAPGTVWSGEVCTVVFKSKVDGKANINFNIQ